ncbi:hypothetical protein DWB78_11860 [Halopelagius longus]|uniref:Uncharacterized protein n=1 Tax=Halopelagius longus TaxID=1236180 RepID=A0A370INV5_9EURY|nr:hypothetical protein DWB78_11860 [Halopelagius longus]
MKQLTSARLFRTTVSDGRGNVERRTVRPLFELRTVAAKRPTPRTRGRFSAVGTVSTSAESLDASLEGGDVEVDAAA